MAGGLLLMLADGDYPEGEVPQTTVTWSRSEAESQTNSHAAGYAPTRSTEQSHTQSNVLVLPQAATSGDAPVSDFSWRETTSRCRAWGDDTAHPIQILSRLWGVLSGHLVGLDLGEHQP